MELQEFIKETLIAVTMGINQANKDIMDSGRMKSAPFKLEPGSDKTKGFGIAIDVAIVAEKNTHTEGAVKGSLSVLGGDLSRSNKHANHHTSRVQFHVAVDKQCS